jgi:hypothetical protein
MHTDDLRPADDPSGFFLRRAGLLTAPVVSLTRLRAEAAPADAAIRALRLSECPMRRKPLPPADALRRMLRYDPLSGKLYWRKRADKNPQWNAKFAGRRAGAVRGGRRYVNVLGHGPLLAYRIIWKMVYESEPTVIDHIDGNPHNDRICNLRAATNAQNMWNKRPHGAIPLKGVSYNKKSGRWVSSICVNGRSIFLGLFHCPADAHASYVRAARKHFGAFARTE